MTTYVILKFALKIFRLVLAGYTIRFLFNASKRRPMAQPFDGNQWTLRTPKELPLIGFGTVVVIVLEFLVRLFHVLENEKPIEPVLMLGAFLVLVAAAMLAGIHYWSQRRILYTPGLITLKGPWGVEKRIMTGRIKDVSYNARFRWLKIRTADQTLRVDIFLEGFSEFIALLKSEVPAEKLKIQNYEKFALTQES